MALSTVFVILLSPYILQAPLTRTYAHTRQQGCYTPTGDMVAIKIIQLQEGESFDDLAVEIEVMTRCHHENVVSFFGCWIKNDELHVCALLLLLLLLLDMDVVNTRANTDCDGAV